MTMWYGFCGKCENYLYLFFSELLRIVSIVQEDERSRKNALPVRGCRVAVFPTQKSQLFVCVCMFIY